MPLTGAAGHACWRDGVNIRDQERIREDSLYKFMQFQWDVLTNVAMSKK